MDRLSNEIMEIFFLSNQLEINRILTFWKIFNRNSRGYHSVFPLVGLWEFLPVIRQDLDNIEIICIIEIGESVLLENYLKATRFKESLWQNFEYVFINSRGVFGKIILYIYTLKSLINQTVLYIFIKTTIIKSTISELNHWTRYQLFVAFL